MTKKAFTLIELLVVITIIILITSWWIIYFFKQICSMKLAWEIQNIVDIVDRLDTEVQSKKILDYSMTIDKIKNARWLSYTTNTLWLNSTQEIDFNSMTGSWTLSIHWTSWWSYAFKIYSWIKFESEKIIDSAANSTENFLHNKEYRITWSLSGSILNTLYIDYYSQDNIIQNNENTLELININNKLDKTWVNYSSVEIKNLNWKKSIKWNSWWELDKIYLFFEREWVEKFIEIKK